ncbi:hypothetical protein BKA56DRAFT_682701 [Ilyonectria sp. MPI-CAGE-AT-0026]|nr:hypothetical protein BKA56DRAFT_682701 [Ilyonectria sp. MPI-CAGE-AT-0026]
MRSQVRRKSVLVTGCSPGGIGHALCLEFHKKGLHVIATARNLSLLSDLAEMGMSTLQLDVTDPVSIAACHKEAGVITDGKLDILVNNAGRTHTHPATDLSIPEVRQTFETNVFGLMAMCKMFVDQLIAAKGLIINIASLAAVTPYVFGSAYCASKAAVASYSRCLRLELRPFEVRVMVCMTGTVRSQIAQNSHRELPSGSLYMCVKDLFDRRQSYSQDNGTMDTGAYARTLVEKALTREVYLILRSWMGRPDWWWFGGMSTKVWITLYLGEWFADTICWKSFGMDKLAKILATAEKDKKRR